MNLRALFLTVGILLAGAVLFLLGGFGEIELVTAGRCGGGSTYLCEPQTADVQPQPADIQPRLDYAALMRAERRVGLR
jgi:hypothetical protein